MRDVFQHCSICRATIFFGDTYGTVIFNKEIIQKTTEGNYTVEVIHSEEMHTMCNRCSTKMDTNGLKGILD